MRPGGEGGGGQLQNTRQEEQTEEKKKKQKNRLKETDRMAVMTEALKAEGEKKDRLAVGEKGRVN